MKTFVSIIEALTPVSHGDVLTGISNTTNTRLFNRQGMLVNGIPCRVPALSDNALRSSLIRYPLHDHLISTLEINRRELPRSVMNFLFSGGNLAAGGKAPNNEIELSIAMMEKYPSIAILGGATDNFILPRSKLRLASWIVCKETFPFIKEIAPQYKTEIERDAENSIFDLVMEEVKTRGADCISIGNQMLYSYETLCAGAKAIIEFSIDSKDEILLSAISTSLELWGGWFGGQGRLGRGRFKIDLSPFPSSKIYLEYIEKNKSDLKQGLIDGTFCTGKRLCKL